MSNAGDVLNRVVDVLTPAGQTTRLTFRRFKGDALATAAANNTEIPESGIDTVVLNVNPSQISFAERKLVQKVPTSSPNRFIIFDWGSELIMLTIQGNTGNLLPDAITAGLSVEPIMEPMLEIAKAMGHTDDALQAASNTKIPATASAIIQNLTFGGMSYFEVLNMSPKFKTFEKLRSIYHLFDADVDVLTLEMGNTVYRGFFEEFTFDITAESPWNWKYTINFVEMENLSEFVNKNDSNYGNNTYIDFTV